MSRSDLRMSPGAVVLTYVVISLVWCLLTLAALYIAGVLP